MLVRTVSIQLPETVFTALGKHPHEFIQEMRIVAAVKWYELGKISQEKAAEIAGLTLLDFIDALSRYKSPEAETKSLQQIAAMPVKERHKLLAQSISSTAEDFLNEPELTFSVLDIEDWDIGND